MTKTVEDILFPNIYRLHIIFLSTITLILLSFILGFFDGINEVKELSAMIGFSVTIGYILLGILTIFLKDTTSKWCERYSFLFVIALILIIGLIIHVTSTVGMFTHPIYIGVLVLLWSAINPLLFWIITDKVAIKTSVNKKITFLNKIVLFSLILITLLIGTIIVVTAPFDEPLSLIVGELRGDTPFVPISAALIIIVVLGSLFLGIEFILSNKKINTFMDSYLYLGIILSLNGIYLILLTMMALENHLQSQGFLSLSIIFIATLITLLYIWFIEFDSKILSKSSNVGLRFIIAGIVLTNITSLTVTRIQTDAENLPYLFLLASIISILSLIFLLINTIPEKQKYFGIISPKIPAILGILVKKEKDKKISTKQRDKEVKNKKRKKRKKKRKAIEEKTIEKQKNSKSTDSDPFDELGEEYDIHLEDDETIDDEFFELLQDEESDKH